MIDPLTISPALWRARSLTAATPLRGLPAAPSLTSLLPHGCWPAKAVSEILYDETGSGECSILMPTVVAATQQQIWSAAIGMPHEWLAGSLSAVGVNLNYWLVLQPFNDALKIWAAEQMLQSRVGLLLLWLSRLDMRASRRLQLAAQQANATVIVLTPMTRHPIATAATLRLALQANEHGLTLHLLKCRGRLPTQQSIPFMPQGVV